MKEQIEFLGYFRQNVTNENGKIASRFRYNIYKYYEKMLYNGYTVVYIDQVLNFPYKRKEWEFREIKLSEACRMIVDLA